MKFLDIMISLKPFTEKDFDRLISWIDSEEDLVQFAGPIFSFPLSKEQLKDYLLNENLKPLKVIDLPTGIVIGHCELNFSSEIPRLSRILIGDINFRGKGLSKFIVRNMIKEIQRLKNCIEVDLNVFDWNKIAMYVYAQEGFVVQSDNKMIHTFKGKTWTIVNMKKDLIEKTKN